VKKVVFQPPFVSLFGVSASQQNYYRKYANFFVKLQTVRQDAASEDFGDDLAPSVWKQQTSIFYRKFTAVEKASDGNLSRG